VRKLQADGFTNLILRTSSELDLRDQAAVARFFKEEQRSTFSRRGKGRGIVANNSYPAEFIYDNLMIQVPNIIHHSWKNGVRKLLSSAVPASIPSSHPSRSRKNTS